MSTRNEGDGVRHYICYLKERYRLSKNGLIALAPGEVEYLEFVLSSIRQFSKSHILFVKYVLGKISREQIRLLLGQGDRGFFRWAKYQRKKFIEYVTEKEIEGFAKFPYSDGEQEILEEINEY